MFEDVLGVNPWTAALTLANTVALFLVLKHFLFQPVMKMIANRQQEIDTLYEDAGKAKASAESLQQAYQEKLSAAQETSQQIVKEAVARGREQEEQIIRQANDRANAIMEKAAADIDQEKKKAINDAKNEISGLAMDIAEKVVGRALSPADQKNLVDEFINELGEKA